VARQLHGVLPIVHTPFRDDDAIDWDGLAREVDWAFAVGADGIGTGMVSEILRLARDERIELAERLVQLAAGRGPVFTAVSSASTEESVALAVSADSAGCDAIMCTPPVGASAPQADLLEHFVRLADAVAIPLIVQDASGYIGESIPLATYVQLLERYGEGKILFKPEASPIGPNLSALRDATNDRARIFEGSGGILLIDSYRRGIAGTMPGMDLLDGIVALWRALATGDESAAYRVYFPICAIVALQLQAGLDGFLAIEKHLLVRRGLLASARRRKPYRWELDAETAAEVDRLFDQLQMVLHKLSVGRGK
jgi:dihydrodipicolinate synthase/N-acetylneuraminate lyase